MTNVIKNATRPYERNKSRQAGTHYINIHRTTYITTHKQRTTQRNTEHTIKNDRMNKNE